MGVCMFSLRLVWRIGKMFKSEYQNLWLKDCLISPFLSNLCPSQIQPDFGTLLLHHQLVHNAKAGKASQSHEDA